MSLADQDVKIYNAPLDMDMLRTSLKTGWDEHIIIVWSLDHVSRSPRG